MTTHIYFVLDVVFYLLQGYLLTLVFQSAQARFPFPGKHTTGVLLLAQYTVVQLFLHNSGWIREMIYGTDPLTQDSRFSGAFLGISLGITYLAARILFREERLRTGGGVLSFYAATELSKTALSVIFVKVLNRITDWNSYLFFEKQRYDAEVFRKILQGTEILWNGVCCLVELLLTWLVIRKLKQYLSMKDSYGKWEQMFLLFPSLIGLFLDLIIRSILFSMKGTDMWLLWDSRPEMQLLLPGISILCILMMITAARMLRNLIDESNQRIEAEIYQSRVGEMEQHIADIERLYTGIRGMRHDMKNYIADMDALMRQDGQRVQPEMRKYLDSLQRSVDQLDMKYHTGHPVTDVVIQRYVQLAERDGIRFETDFVFPTGRKIDAFDLSIIMNNALENAIEACRKQTSGEKWIVLNAFRRENMFFMIFRNSFDGEVSRENGKMKTTKQDTKNHGYGLQNIGACAEKYYGRVETKITEGCFELAVMLQEQE